MRAILLSVCVCSLFFIKTKAQPGTLDPAFGTGGTATFLPQPLVNKAYGLAQQPDGKILLAGQVLANGTHLFHLSRLLPDGSLDAQFGASGSVELPIGTDALCYAMALQPDGRILLAGSAKLTTNGTTDFAIARFLTDGQPDPTFSADGIQTVSLASGDETARSLAVQPDGRILVAGASFSTNGSLLSVARLMPDGSPDPTFSSDGKATLAVGTFFTEGYAMALQPDGKVVVVGSAKFGMADDVAVARFMPDGSLDATFGNMGHVVTDLGSDADAANAVVLQPDGKIVAAGTTGASRDFALVRWMADGSPDPAFGVQGTVKTDFFGADDIANSVVLQAGGHILAGGYAYIASSPEFAMARYGPDGSPDNSFGDNGQVVTDFGNSFDFAFPMALQLDGNILLGGYSFSNGHTALAVARYISDLNVGTVDLGRPLPAAIFPNPVGRAAFFDFETKEMGAYSLQLFNASGRMVQSFFLNKDFGVGKHREQLVFDKNGAAGWYSLKLSGGGHAISVKVLKG